MKTKNKLIAFLVTATSASLIATSSAATLTWDNNVAAGVTGGDGAWNTTDTNWTTDAGATNIAWENLVEAPFHDAAITAFATANSTATITVSGSISLKNLTISTNLSPGTSSYTITGASGTLAFTGGTIFFPNSNRAHTISTNVSGAPTINTTATGSVARTFNYTVPASGSMVLGNMVSAVHSNNDHVSTINLAGGSNSTGELGSSLASNGTGVGNRLYFNSATWTLKGVAYSRDQWINGGTAIIATGGQLRSSSREVLLQAGTLHYNHAGAVRHDNTSFDPGRIFRIIGGTLNNTSGAAITTSTHNPDMVWGGNFTFSGTNGADSNLFLGNGRISLGATSTTPATRTVTVSNAATTLSVGGVISNSSGSTPTVGTGNLTKAGAGTLELRGVSTYSGITTISAGTLKMGANNVIANASNVSIGNATLDVNTRTDTVGTLDVTSTAKINIGTGAALAFADSKAVDWTGGTLNIIGTLEATSIRFGDSADDLTPDQLALISVNGSGTGTYVLDANGYLVPGGGGDVTPPTLISITDNISGGPLTVGNTVTYTVTFSEDIDAASVTAADFDNNGTAGITVGAITETTPGVFTVAVTANSPGTLKLRIPTGSVIEDLAMNGLVVPVEDDTTITVQTQYQAWAGGALFDADANGDGVSNGLAFVLGASGPGENALSKLPTVTETAGGLVMTFEMLNAASRGTVTLSIEHSSDLGISDAWEAAPVPEEDSTVNDVLFDISGSAPLGIQAIIPSSKASGGKLFGRLKATHP